MIDNSDNSSDKDKKRASSIVKSKPYYAKLSDGVIFLYDNKDKNVGMGTIILSQYNVKLSDTQGMGEALIYSTKMPIVLTAKNTSLRNKSAPHQESSKAALQDFDKTKKTDKNIIDSRTMHFYFSTPFEKEDWYFEMLKHSLDMSLDSDIKTAKLLGFGNSWTESYNSKDTWLNIIIERIVMGTIFTSKMKQFFVDKVKEKCAMLKKLPIISDISVLDLDLGYSAPKFDNVELLKAGDKGQIKINANIRYHGDTSITLKIDLVLMNILIPITAKLKVISLSGKALFLIKKPPSNRIWIGFYKNPKIDIDIEPTVMSKGINNKKIIDFLKSKLLGFFDSNWVLPNMDDTVFMVSENEGGIFPSMIDDFENLKKFMNFSTRIDYDQRKFKSSDVEINVFGEKDTQIILKTLEKEVFSKKPMNEHANLHHTEAEIAGIDKLDASDEELLNSQANTVIDNNAIEVSEQVVLCESRSDKSESTALEIKSEFEIETRLDDITITKLPAFTCESKVKNGERDTGENKIAHTEKVELPGNFYNPLGDVSYQNELLRSASDKACTIDSVLSDIKPEVIQKTPSIQQKLAKLQNQHALNISVDIKPEPPLEISSGFNLAFHPKIVKDYKNTNIDDDLFAKSGNDDSCGYNGNLGTYEQNNQTEDTITNLLNDEQSKNSGNNTNSYIKSETILSDVIETKSALRDGTVDQKRNHLISEQSKSSSILEKTFGWLMEVHSGVEVNEDSSLFTDYEYDSITETVIYKDLTNASSKSLGFKKDSKVKRSSSGYIINSDAEKLGYVKPSHNLGREIFVGVNDNFGRKIFLEDSLKRLSRLHNTKSSDPQTSMTSSFNYEMRAHSIDFPRTSSNTGDLLASFCTGADPELFSGLPAITPHPPPKSFDVDIEYRRINIRTDKTLNFSKSRDLEIESQPTMIKEGSVDKVIQNNLPQNSPPDFTCDTNIQIIPATYERSAFFQKKQVCSRDVGSRLEKDVYRSNLIKVKRLPKLL